MSWVEITREQLVALFDECQLAYNEWQETKEKLKFAQDKERKAGNVYLNAKLRWEKALKGEK